MTIHLTPDQERRIRALIQRSTYKSVEEVVEAAMAAVVTRPPEFSGTEQEIAALFEEGLSAKELVEQEFWESVDRRTESMLAAHLVARRSASTPRRPRVLKPPLL